MRRYIDADKFKLDIKDVAEINGGSFTEFEVLGILSGQPAADVRENVRGEWVTPTEKIYSVDGEDITPAYKECNRCHKVYVRTNDNFCPNCGADMMDGEADDESRIN